MTTPDLLTRLEKATFSHRIEIGNGEECWLWQGALDHRRRGRIWIGSRLKLAHRAVWEFLEGPIPAGYFVCHHCDNPQCVNPGHLYLGYHADNMRDVRQRRRTDREACRRTAKELGSRNNWAIGSANPKARLTEDDAREIKSSTQATHDLAARFGVSYTSIQRIRRGATWKHVSASPPCAHG